jgi:hypothetical protein
MALEDAAVFLVGLPQSEGRAHLQMLVAVDGHAHFSWEQSLSRVSPAGQDSPCPAES